MNKQDYFMQSLQLWADSFMCQSMHGFVHFAREQKLSMSQIGTLFRLHKCGGCGISDISEHLGITTAAASQMIEKLVQQGLITRSEDAQDRRIKRLVLTPQGQHLVSGTMEARQHWFHDLASNLNDDELQHCAETLQLLCARIPAQPKEPSCSD